MVLVPCQRHPLGEGNYNNGSDIDLTLTGKNLTISKQFSIATKLDDLLLPHKIDLSIYHKIDNPELIDHINRVGVIFYKRNAQVEMIIDKVKRKVSLKQVKLPGNSKRV